VCVCVCARGVGVVPVILRVLVYCAFAYACLVSMRVVARLCVRVCDASACVACRRCEQMLMTALDCTARGLTFAAVHDSYWTHACDVDVMNDALREQFIKLYEMPLLEQLRDSFCLRFPMVCALCLCMRRCLLVVPHSPLLLTSSSLSVL
jgi:hypothetical protein